MMNNEVIKNEEIFSNAFNNKERRNGQLCINLTKMAKAFGKEAKEWFKLPSAKSYIANLLEISVGGKSPNADNQQVMLFETKQGGLEQGTWSYNNLLTIEFARWLSVPFAIWCNQKIETLMKEGVVKLNDMPTADSSKIEWIRFCLKQAEENEQLMLENKQQADKIEQDRPKVEFAEDILCAECTILVGEFAKVLAQNGYKIGGVRLFKWFRDNGYMGKSGQNYNIPCQKYVEMGLFQIKQTTWSKPNGTSYVAQTPVITSKGQEYFLNIFRKMPSNQSKY